MNEFQILTPDSTALVITKSNPIASGEYQLHHGQSYMTKGDFGNMIFQHYKADQFDIWYSNYIIKKSASFTATVTDAVLELQIPLVNTFKSSWDGMEHVEMGVHQFEITFAPFVKTKAMFACGIDCQTFDIHFTKESLESYALHCRMLNTFLENVYKNKPANLLNMVEFISPDMLRIIRTILSYNKDVVLGKMYFKTLIEELLLLLTIQVAGLTDRFSFSAGEIAKAQEARKIIVADFENNYTIEQLAKMTGTTELKLQMAFKHVFGNTIYKYSKQARLEYAYMLLQTNNYPLRVISTMTGYPDAPNFCIAFKNRFGFAPGKVQRNTNG